jgi:membrane-bound lytic murein transglycosylase D
MKRTFVTAILFAATAAMFAPRPVSGGIDTEKYSPERSSLAAFALPEAEFCTDGDDPASPIRAIPTGPAPCETSLPGLGDPESHCTIWISDLNEEGGLPTEDIVVDTEARPIYLLDTYREDPRANSSVERSVNLFSGRLRGNFALWLERSGKYLRLMQEILREEDLPEDIVYLALIESGFNPKAYSRSKAAGPWQFIAGTGRRYGLRIDSWVDERRDPIKSTRAAAAYLTDLHDMFGSWSLAFAAYNAGEGRVRRAVSRTGTDDFWSIVPTRHLKRETKDYVPHFIAARMIALEPEKYGFYDLKYHDEFEYDVVELDMQLTLDVAARCAGTTFEVMKELNPELKRGCTPPVKAYSLRVPAGSRDRFVTALAAIPPSERFTIRHYLVRKGDTISGIARRMGVPASEIVDQNKLKRDGRLIRAGQELLIPIPLAASRIEKADRADIASRIRGGAYVVRAGDTITSIALASGVSTRSLLAANSLASRSIIRPGQKIVIPAN